MEESLIALLASGVRLSLAEARLTAKEVVSAVGASLLLVAASVPLLIELGLSDGTRLLTSTGLSFFSRDILLILITLKDQISRDPLGFIRDYLNWRNDRND